jgi:hypothetical protein
MVIRGAIETWAYICFTITFIGYGAKLKIKTFCAFTLHRCSFTLHRFFESLLQDIDLCQLDSVERQFQIGWYPGVIRDECHSFFC